MSPERGRVVARDRAMSFQSWPELCHISASKEKRTSFSPGRGVQAVEGPPAALGHVVGVFQFDGAGDGVCRDYFHKPGLAGQTGEAAQLLFLAGQGALQFCFFFVAFEFGPLQGGQGRAHGLGDFGQIGRVVDLGIGLGLPKGDASAQGEDIRGRGLELASCRIDFGPQGAHLVRVLLLCGTPGDVGHGILLEDHGEGGGIGLDGQGQGNNSIFGRNCGGFGNAGAVREQGGPNGPGGRGQGKAREKGERGQAKDEATHGDSFGLR